MHRLLIPPEAVQGPLVIVRDPASLHHLCRVLRVGVGDRLECFDGQGHRYFGSVVQRTLRMLTMAIDRRTTDPPLAPSLTLAQAMIRPERFEWVVEKATELGVARIIPMVTVRTVRATAGGPSSGRLRRWQRIAETAATQSGWATVPRLEAPSSFQHVVQQVHGHHLLLPTLTDQARPLTSEVDAMRRARQIAILIGPEGDFTSEEVATAQQAGAHPVRLGRATLRSETAAIAALAILQHAVGYNDGGSQQSTERMHGTSW